MQTFLPYQDFTETAKCLDYRRLGKQRVEAKRILKINLFRTCTDFTWVYCRNCEEIYYLPGQPNFSCPKCGSKETTGRGATNTTVKIVWENHPAVLMWRGYELALAEYGIAICKEWIRRGYKDNTLEFFEDNCLENDEDFSIGYPNWYTNQLELYKVIQSHRSNLLRKDFDYYSKFNWNDVDDTLPYYWPIRKEN